MRLSQRVYKRDFCSHVFANPDRYICTIKKKKCKKKNINNNQVQERHVLTQQLHTPSSRLDTSRLCTVPINALKLGLLHMSWLILPQR